MATTRLLPADAILSVLPAAVARLKGRRTRPADRLYWNDPVAWLHDRVVFPEGERPTGYQEECLAAVAEYYRASGRAPHGAGKSSIAAWIFLWFVDTRNRAGADWKAITTAGSWGQLRNFLWPEIHKWERRIPSLHWREGSELLQMSVKLATGQASSIASNRPELIEGGHADEILFLYDEAKSIRPETYDATEGAFSGAGPGSGRHAFAWAGSTPGPPVGRFAEIHHHKPGLEDWWTRHITLDEGIAAGRITREWADQRAKQWGADSAVYLNRVLGEFAVEDADAVIPLSWLEAANDRWTLLDGAWEDFTCVATDVARYGDDRTVLARRHGNAIAELRASEKEETTATTGRVRGVLDAFGGGYAVVDVIGIGAGVVDQLREKGYTVVAFNASTRSQYLDRAGELGFLNRRSAAWWNLREMLDPSFEPVIALPPDDMLTGDLTTPTWRVTSGARIAVEGKDEIKKRIGRSPDYGDSVVMAFSLPEEQDQEGTVVWDEYTEISRY